MLTENAKIPYHGRVTLKFSPNFIWDSDEETIEIKDVWLDENEWNQMTREEQEKEIEEYAIEWAERQYECGWSICDSI